MKKFIFILACLMTVPAFSSNLNVIQTYEATDETTGDLFIEVYDYNNEDIPIVGATLSLYTTSGTLIAQTFTDGFGTAWIKNIPTGIYILLVTDGQKEKAVKVPVYNRTTNVKIGF
ncbi:MAG: T9SS type A sorting domain-containing protein [Bacteroidales bacterium]|nr:T9SS type A sorting domain-containing protein [Bacteroides sp.]MCM1198851.1 T9SS type A sorting domain-containing protein [Clostridium sp.]MCM1503301.1 T9SS type A sorting domain-containing protein [Bacteroidales bacterium]